MNRSAYVCIRINSGENFFERVTNELNQNNICWWKSDFVPSCVIIKERTQLTNLNTYKNGAFTIQDEASQLVGYCANPAQN